MIQEIHPGENPIHSSTAPMKDFPTPQAVYGLFEALAEQYDRFNRFSSLGMDGLWRREVIKPLRPGMRVLDLGTGTGDLVFEAYERMNGEGEWTGLDFSPKMLAIARLKEQKKLLKKGRIHWVERDARLIPFEAEPYDAVISGFVLRNLYHHIDEILQAVFASLRPGGLVSFVDLTEPAHPVLARLHAAFVECWVKACGRLFFGSRGPVQYLGFSIRQFIKPEALRDKLERAGFVQVKSRSMALGVVTLYTAVRPQGNPA